MPPSHGLTQEAAKEKALLVSRGPKARKTVDSLTSSHGGVPGQARFYPTALVAVAFEPTMTSGRQIPE